MEQCKLCDILKEKEEYIAKLESMVAELNLQTDAIDGYEVVIYKKEQVQDVKTKVFVRNNNQLNLECLIKYSGADWLEVEE
jgi:hypothetical protein